MMFGGKRKRESHALQLRLAEMELDIVAMRSKLASLKDESESLRAEAAAAAAACEVAREIYGNMQSFGKAIPSPVVEVGNS